MMHHSPDTYMSHFIGCLFFFSETIWSATVSVCTQVQEMTTTQGQQLLRELQWRQIYGSDALFNVLAHIVDYFNNQAAA